LLDDVYAEKADAARNRNKVGAREVCPLPFYQPAVHADGTVSMCCVDWNKKTAVGNIFEQSLSEIWHGDKVRAFQTMHIERRSHENEACRNCTYFHDQPDNIDDLTDAGILLRKPASLELSTNRK
jgi:radical SAM protein with 4Fe4S-binding SPASM domain